MNEELLKVLSDRKTLLTQNDEMKFRIPKGLLVQMKKTKDDYPFAFWKMRVSSGDDHRKYILIFNSVKSKFWFEDLDSIDF